MDLTNITRRDLEIAAETSREVRDVLESHFIGDLGNRPMAFRIRNQDFISALQALGLDELIHCGFIVVEQTIEIAQRNTAACRDLPR